MLLIPMYSVFSAGLQNYDPTAMLEVFGFQLAQPSLPSGHVHLARTRPALHQPDGRSGVDLSQPQVLFTMPVLGISLLAIISSAAPARSSPG